MSRGENSRYRTHISTEIKSEVSPALDQYRRHRYWLLHELLQVQVQGESGSISMANARRDQRQLQKKLLALRRSDK